MKNLFTKRNLFSLLVCLLMINSLTQAQTYFQWANQFGGTVSNDAGKGIVVDALGNVYTVGSFYGTVDFNPGAGVSNLTSAGSSDIYISKLDVHGNFVWARRIGSTLADEGLGICMDPSGNFFITGSFQGTVNFAFPSSSGTLTSAGMKDIFLVKFNPAGSSLWSINMGGTSDDVGTSVATDASGSIFCSGYFNGVADFNPFGPVLNFTSIGGEDIFITKLSSGGTFFWSKQLGSTNDDRGLSLKADASNIYTTGFFGGGGSSPTMDLDPNAGVFNVTSSAAADIFISKLDGSGNFVYGRKMGGNGNDLAYSMDIGTGGNIYTTGSFNGTCDFDPGAGAFNLTGSSYDIFVSILDPTGNFIGALRMGGTGSDAGSAIKVDAAGNIYTTGTFSNTVDFDPGAGTFNLTSAGSDDMFISKLSSTGNFAWAVRMGGTLFYDEGHALAYDSYGNVYTTGNFQSTVDFDPNAGTYNLTSTPTGVDAFVLKLSQCPTPPSPTNTTSGANQSICSGNSTTLSTTSTGTLSWYATATSTSVLGTGNSFVTPALTAGTYTYYAEDFTCVPSATRTIITVTVNNVPTVTLTASSSSVCSGSSVSLTASGAATYSWNTSATTAVISVTPNTTTNYTVTGANGTCTNTKTISINVTASPTVNTTASSNTICTGNTTTISATGATTYSWNTSATTNSISVSPTVTTTYTVTGITGTCSNTKTITIVNNTPVVNISASSNTICTGNTATITATGATTYSWNTSATTNSISVSPTVTTTYTVTGVNGSCNNTKTITITNNTPSVNLSTTSSTICSGSTVTLSASGATTYSWNTSATTSSISVSPAISTNYTVTGTSLGCTNSKTISINVTTTPTVNTSASSSAICTGNTTTLTASGATTYSWNTSATTSSISVSPTVTTIYTVTGVSGGCSNTNTILITNNTPNLNVSATSTNICTGGTATLTASGATTYSWNTSATTAVINVSPSSSTTYTVTGTTGACSTTSTIPVNVTSAINLNIASTMSVSCSGAPVVLTASGASTYTWSTGPSTTTISVSPTSSTSYTVNGTSGTCSGSTVITIGASTNPTINSITSSSLICSLPTQQSATLTASGATTYSWNTGATTAAITVSPGITTTYTVTGYNTQGCMNTSVITQSVSLCSGVDELNSENEIIIFPNPSNGEFTVKGVKGNFEIINSIGQTIYNSDLNDNQEVKITSLAQGIYYLKIKESKVYKKIIVVN